MNKNLINQLTGKTNNHLVFHPKLNCHIHKNILSSLNLLDEHLTKNSFQLKVISSFRSYEKQKKIWEEKVHGQRAILDKFENQINIEKLNKTELLFAILNWSMIPGFSRHHWGTELDICDSNKLSPDYQIQLTNIECSQDGPFYKFHIFLDELIKNDKCFGFYRPYLSNSNGVRPERWHLSHHKSSIYYLDILNLDLFENFIKNSDISLREEILKHSEVIFNKYIVHIINLHP